MFRISRASAAAPQSSLLCSAFLFSRAFLFASLGPGQVEPALDLFGAYQSCAQLAQHTTWNFEEQSRRKAEVNFGILAGAGTGGTLRFGDEGDLQPRRRSLHPTPRHPRRRPG